MSTPAESTWTEWGADDARAVVRVPQPHDDKYSRGVLGVRTGSVAYPGAAVLGVEGAARTGVGMIRYLGPGRAARLVLQRRPETVTEPGRVQAWLLGSGMDVSRRSKATTAELRAALAEGVPVVLDAGALDLVGEAHASTVITPHAGELAALWSRSGTSTDRRAVTDAPGEWAARTAGRFGVTVLLKGARTFVASPLGERFLVTATGSWSATAGSGDVLGGILGALLATNSTTADPADSAAGSLDDLLHRLPRIAASAAFIHQSAGLRASGGAPITALDLADAVPRTIAGLLGTGDAGTA